MGKSTNFVLTYYSREYGQIENTPRIRVKQEAYDTLVEWAHETGLPLSELASRAIAFAAEHLTYVKE